MGNKSMDAIVSTMDAELNFAIQSSTTGRQLFDELTKAIGLRETWYFGLQYINNKEVSAWLKLDKKVLKQDLRKGLPLHLKFRAKFFPESVEDEIIQDVTLRLFYLQIKELVLSGVIYCSAEIAVLLASYAMQVKYGDFDSNQHKPGFLDSERLLPIAVSSQYKLSNEEWHKRIMAWWGDHRNIQREFAMMEYLKIAQDLETYGVSYFEIRNTKGSEIYLGVDALGLSVYERSNKVTAKVGFPWSEVRNISFRNKKFVIKPVDRGSTHFVFYASDVSVNKRILSLCMGNHELYMRRRKPLPVEMQQLKQQADEEKMQRQVEQERLIRETEARESAEKKQREYEEEMLRMKFEMDKMQHQLEQDRLITELAAREAADQRQKECEEEMRRVMENMENLRLQSPKQAIVHVEQNQAIFHAKPDQSPRSPLLYVALNPDQSAEKGAAHSKPVVSPKYTPEHKEQKSVQLNDHKPGSAGKEREQIKSAEKSKDVKNKLEILTKELEMVKETDRMEDIDKQHLENKKAGRDKYKTFRQIRSGNTKRRIDQYENM